jgi:tripartite-type tricarboxylate transporter receptor subunit TctC
MTRRRTLRLLAAAALAVGCAAAHAQPYPSRPVRLVVPYPAGQGTDVVGRYLAEQLSRAIGQNVVVENRPGAGGNIGTQQVARAAPDGYTLLLGTNGTHAAAPFLYPNLGFDPEADFEPIALTRIMALPETQQKLLQLGIDPKAATGDELKAFLRTERDKWGQVIRSANRKVE